MGSTSTKAVVTALDGRVLAGLYGRTQGDPVQAVTGLLAQVKPLFKATPLEIRGVATTGSGRELIREVVGADMAVNEITAHARGAAFLDPEVDTIIEIGGQDSKFTRMGGEILPPAYNELVIHANPVFCCPGVISSSIFRKIQERFHIPIIDLFYDGTNKPNRMIDPHMFYLTKQG